MPLRDVKEEVFNAILVAKVPYTVVDCGFWYSLSFPRVPRFVPSLLALLLFFFSPVKADIYENYWLTFITNAQRQTRLRQSLFR